MDFDLTLAGYRCFAPDAPATLSFRDDVVAFVGVNNSGKSTLLRAVYELRSTFKALLDSEQFKNALTGNVGFNPPAEIGDPDGIYWHFGQTDIQVELVLRTRSGAISQKLGITIARKYRRVSLTLYDVDGKPVPQDGNWNFSNNVPFKQGFNLGLS